MTTPKLSVAVHVLVWIVLQTNETGQAIDLDELVERVSAAAVIRPILMRLNAAGIVSAREQPADGWEMAHDPAGITLADVEGALEPTRKSGITTGPLTQAAAATRQGQTSLATIADADAALDAALNHITIADMVNDVLRGL
jgi:DNA-binding IscR family transcriptional regulator